MTQGRGFKMATSEKPNGSQSKLLILVAVIVVIVIVGLFLVLRSPETAADAVRELPDQTLRIETAAGEEIELTVKNASLFEGKTSGFNDVDADVVNTTVLFVSTAFSATSVIEVRDLKAPIEIAFFTAEGDFMEMHRFSEGASEEFAPTGRYMHLLEARAGFFEEQGIGEGSSLLL